MSWAWIHRYHGPTDAVYALRCLYDVTAQCTTSYPMPCSIDVCLYDVTAQCITSYPMPRSTDVSSPLLCCCSGRLQRFPTPPSSARGKLSLQARRCVGHVCCRRSPACHRREIGVPALSCRACRRRRGRCACQRKPRAPDVGRPPPPPPGSLAHVGEACFPSAIADDASVRHDCWREFLGRVLGAWPATAVCAWVSRPANHTVAGRALCWAFGL
jgi:hypothetical protein